MVMDRGKGSCDVRDVVTLLGVQLLMADAAPLGRPGVCRGLVTVPVATSIPNSSDERVGEWGDLQYRRGVSNSLELEVVSKPRTELQLTCMIR